MKRDQLPKQWRRLFTRPIQQPVEAIGIGRCEEEKYIQQSFSSAIISKSLVVDNQEAIDTQ